MNKQLLALALCGGATALFAQQAFPVLQGSKAHTVGTVVPSTLPDDAPTSSQLRAVPFYSEDFSGGAIPTGWANMDILTPSSGDPVTFVWSNDPGIVSTASLNAPNAQTFDATGASDGFLWANSDRGLTAAPLDNHQTVLSTTAIDCSLQPSVLLSVTSLIGVFDLDANVNAILRVSNDSVNWTDFTLLPCLVVGSPLPPCARWSANPDISEIDITSVAGGQSTVYLQFNWTGGWEYFWALDDVQLTEVPDYERVLVSSYISHTGDGYEYAKTPEDQLPADMFVGLTCRNFGVQDQTNVVLTADIKDAVGSSVITSSMSFPTVLQNDTVTFENLESASGLTPGVYTGTFEVHSDQDSLETNAADDVITRTFEIGNATNDVYALDGIGIYPNPVLSTIGTSSFADGADGFLILTFFRVINDATFEGAEALIANTSSTGGELTFALHYADDVDNDDVFTTIAESGTILITQQHVTDEKVRGAFPFPPTLVAGDYYLSVTLNSLGNTSDIILYDDATVPQPGDAGLIYISAGTTPGLFTNGNAPALRLSTDPTIGIEESEQTVDFIISPNPTNDIFNVSTPEAGKVTMEIRNMLGELISTEQFSNRTTVDMSGYASGVYTVRLANGTASRTQLVTLK